MALFSLFGNNKKRNSQNSNKKEEKILQELRAKQKAKEKELGLNFFIRCEELNIKPGTGQSLDDIADEFDISLVDVYKYYDVGKKEYEVQHKAMQEPVLKKNDIKETVKSETKKQEVKKSTGNELALKFYIRCEELNIKPGTGQSLDDIADEFDIPLVDVYKYYDVGKKEYDIMQKAGKAPAITKKDTTKNDFISKIERGTKIKNTSFENHPISRSNMFVNIENQFKYGTNEEITNYTLNAFSEIISYLFRSDNVNEQGVFMMLIAAAGLGMWSNNKQLNFEEKELINKTFGQIWNGDMDIVYNLLTIEESPDEELDIIRNLMKVNRDQSFAFDILYLILGFAYIDGEVNDSVLSKLDGIYGMNLLALFMDSGLEEVPVPQIRLYGLEAEIVEWFQSDNQLRTLNDIFSHFPNKSKNEIKLALDSLCEKGILYGGENIVGCRYGLA